MTAYGEAALTAEIAAVRSTGDGGRNAQLNRSAFAVAQLVAGRQLDAKEAREALQKAAGDSGLEKQEVETTLKSGWRAGMNQPRYPYRDAAGAVLYAKTRLDRPGQKYGYESPDKDGGWKPGRGDARPVPYRLPELIAAPSNQILFMAEGEKHADKLASWGLLATSHKDWCEAFEEYVTGRDVVILPDNDVDGTKQAEKASALVTRAGGRAFIIDLPGLPPKGDIMDWTGDAAGLKSLTAAAIEARKCGKAKPVVGLAAAKGISAAALMAKPFNPVRYIVSKYLAEGLTLFAGSPKIGKSWMALDIAVAVAGGSPVFGSVPCSSGDVLYLALEDNERRLKSRLIHKGIVIPPARLTFMTEWPAVDDGCLDELELWAQSVDEPTLVVVDVLAKVRPAANGRDQLYDADYRTMSGLQSFAGRYGLSVLVVHHTRKMEADDPFDTVSGTRGLTGAADTVMVLKRDNGTSRTVLYVRGRDVEEIETAFEFKKDNGTWVIVGAAHEVAKTSERQGILDALIGQANPLSAREISDVLGKNYDAVRKCLTRMAHNGEIEKAGRGMYRCPNGPIVPSNDQPDIGTHGTGGILIERTRSFPHGNHVFKQEPADARSWDDLAYGDDE